MENQTQRKILLVLIGLLAVLLVLLSAWLGVSMVNRGKASVGSQTAAGAMDSSAKGDSGAADEKTDATAKGKSDPNAKYKKAAQKYAEVLDEIDKYNFGEPQPGSTKAEYAYSLGDMNGDKIPDMRVVKETTSAEGGTVQIRFFSSDGTDSPIVAPDKIFETGWGSAGSFHGGTNFAKDGNGVVDGYVSGGTGKGEDTLYQLQGNQLVETQRIAFNMWDDSHSSTSKGIETYRSRTIGLNNRAYLYFLEHGDLKTLEAELAKDDEDPEPAVPADATPKQAKQGKSKK